MRHRRDRSLPLRALLAAGVALPLAVAPAAAEEAAKPDAAVQSASAPAAGPHVAVSKLLGQQVQGANGETLGEIDDIIFSGPDVLAPFALVSVGGVAGIGDRLVALPLGDIQRTADGQLTYPRTEEYVLAQPTYRRADSPTTGPIAPGPERSQEAQGAGNPNQPMESVPGVFQKDAGDQTAQRPDSPAALDRDVPFDQRESFLRAAEQSMDQWANRLRQADLDQEARQRVKTVLDTTRTRLDRLKGATEDNWQALRDTTAAAFGKVAAVWAEASPQSARRDGDGTTQGGARRGDGS